MKYALGNMLNGAGGLNADGLALDLQFATDKTLTARKGPTPTFTRASGATQVNSTGLVEFAPENLYLYSQAFGTGDWTKTRTSILSDVAIAPDGTLTAEKLVEDTTASASHTIGAGTTPSTLLHRLSIYAKKGERSWIVLRLGGANDFFNLNTGTATTNINSPIITDVGNGWYRCSVASSGGTQGSFLMSNDGVNTLYTGDGTSGIFIWGAQLERSSVARTYIPTTTAAVYGARFDHDPVTLACKGLLIEEARTNELIRSNEFTDASWVKTTIVTGSTINLSPDGGNNATLLIAGSGIVSWIYRSGITVSGKTVTYFAKSSGKRWSVVDASSGAGTAGVWFDLQNGVVGTVASGYTASIEPFPNGFYRCRVTYPASGAGSFTVIGVSDNNSSFASTASGSNGIIIYGAQLEAGGFPTSYIPTTTASVIRSADVCSITGADFTSFYNQAEGTLFSRSLKLSTNINSFVLHASDGSFANGTDLRYSNISQVMALINVSNVPQLTGVNTNITSGVSVGQSIAYRVNDCAYSVNGASPVIDTSVLIPSVNRMNLGSAWSNTLPLNGHISAIRYYRKRLANAKLQAITV